MAPAGAGPLSDAERVLLRSLAAVDGVVELLTGRPVIRPGFYRLGHYCPSSEAASCDPEAGVLDLSARSACLAASRAPAERAARQAVAPLRHPAPHGDQIIELRFTARTGLSQRYEAFLEALCGALAMIADLGGHPVLIDVALDHGGRRTSYTIEAPMDGLEAHAFLARGGDPEGWVAR